MTNVAKQQLLIILLAISAFPISAFAHKAIEAKDYAGESVLATGLPIDYRQTCGGCHDIDTINMGYHSQMGRLATLPPEVYKKYRKRSGDTLPLDQADLSTPWFAHNPIYGKGGMYGRTAMNHNQKLAPISTTNPLAAAFTTPDQQNGPCGACHPGGGFATEDRLGNRLGEKSRSEITTALADGTYLGDYLRSDNKTGKLKPYTWTIKVGDKEIPNLREIDCLICHGADYNLAAARKYIGKGLSAWGATVGARLGKVGKDKKVSYNVKRVKKLADLIAPASTETCARCHATAYDIDGDGLMTLADNQAFAATPSIKNSPGLKKRGQATGNTIAKVKGVSQRFMDPNVTVKYYDPASKSWQPVPYLDAHLEAGLTCMDCHQPLGGGDRLKKPGHDLAKGSAGYNVRSDLSGTSRCESCHESYLDDHQGTFGPAWVTAGHMEKIHCATCHIPRKFVALGESVMKDRGNLGKPDSYKNVMELDGYGKVSIPTAPDYVYYPDKNPATGKYDLKIKAANIMSEMYWATADGTPLADRILAQAFRKAANTFSLKNTGSAAIFKLAWFKDGKARKLKNGVSITTETVAVYNANQAVVIPAHLADARGISAQAPIIGRKTAKGIRFDRNLGKTGWVVMKAGNNEMVNPVTGETMLVRADGTEWTLVDRDDEIRFAAKALEAAINKVTGLDERVKYVYHQTIYDGAFIMSHNVAPVKGFAADPMHVLQCRDCHEKGGVFNRPLKTGVHIDKVAGITEFEMPLTALDENSGSFSENDLRNATFAYYGNTMISLMPLNGEILVKAAWNRIDGYAAEPLAGKRLPKEYTNGMEQAVRLHLSGSKGVLRIFSPRVSVADLRIKTWPAGMIAAQKMDGASLILTLNNPGKDLVLAIAGKDK
jgi:hypothetical protein